jgi:DNA-sulfur modification-associated
VDVRPDIAISDLTSTGLTSRKHLMEVVSTTPADELDLSAGQYVKGLPLTKTMFMVTSSFKQLRTVTRNPIHLQPGARPAAFDSEEIQEEREIHELIQRALAGNKAKNVPSYRRYIEEVVLGGEGVLPPIHLWSETGLDVVRHGASHYAVVPNGEHLLAIDGETQLAAHWELDEMATPENRKAHREFPLACILHHGIGRGTARQYFHDLNVLAVRPNTSLGLSMDTKDPVMKVVGDLETRIPMLFGQVEKQARQLKKNSPKIVTLQSLRQMVINVDKGISGVQYGARPAPIEEEGIDDLRDVALDWVGSYLNTFDREVRDRDGCLASSGPVLAAVGAMGQVLLRAPRADRAELRSKLLDTLRDVDWSKGDHWLGIAGNFTPGGVFSVKGTKEVAYAVFNSLTDPANGGYNRIRHLGRPAGEPETATLPTPHLAGSR